MDDIGADQVVKKEDDQATTRRLRAKAALLAAPLITPNAATQCPRSSTEVGASAGYPFHPHKRTSSVRYGRSVSCQFQTSAPLPYGSHFDVE